MSTTDELIQRSIAELKEQLVEPEQYTFEGIYNLLGGIYNHSGTMFIDKNMVLVGEVTDVDSVTLHKLIKGKISVDDESIKINFVKINPVAGYPVYYELIKPRDNGEITGYYNGVWTSQKEGLLTAQKEALSETSERLIIKRAEQSNIGNLRLVRSVGS